MGDRGCVCLIYDAPEENNKVWLYTHWNGGKLEETVKNALIRGRARWDDQEYLARIIFCQMLIDGNGKLESNTGFGIAPYPMDYNNPYIYVDLKNSSVKVGDSGQELKFHLFINE